MGADLELILGLFSSGGLRRLDRAAFLHVLGIAVLVLASVIFINPSCFAFHLTLEWDPNVEEDLAGYIVYYGTASRNYKYDVDIGDQTSCTISGLAEGKRYYFAVTAYDEEGNESTFSREVVYPSIPEAETSGASGASGGGGGGGGCFVTSAADGRWSMGHLVTFAGVLLAGILGLMIYRRVRPGLTFGRFN